MTAALSVFYPLVTVSVPSAPIPVVNDAIVRACRHFCKETHALWSDIPVATVATQVDYPPALTAMTEFLSVESVRRTSTGQAPVYLTAKSREWVDAQAASTGPPSYYTTTEDYPIAIRFYSTPSSIESLTARIVVMPTLAATVVDDRLGDWYKQAVAAYAKHLLYVMPNAPWSNAGEAQFAATQFDTFATDAIIRRSQSRANISQQTEMRPFA